MSEGPAIDRKTYLALLLVAAILFAIYGFGLLLAPFLVPIAWAMCLVTVTGGLYRRLAKRTKRPRLSAFIMTVATAILLVAPLAVIGSILVREAISLSRAPIVQESISKVRTSAGAKADDGAGKPAAEPATPGAPGEPAPPTPKSPPPPVSPPPADAPETATVDADGVVVVKTGDAWEDFFVDHPTLDTIRRQIDEKLGAFQTDVRSVKDAALALLGQPFQAGAVGVLKGLFSTFFGFLIMLATLFVLYRDGDKIRDLVVDVVPLHEEKTHRILDALRATAFAAIVGGLATALFQGFLGGVAFAITGVSTPVFWGFVMAFLSLLPIGGSAFVWAPVMVYQFATGHPGAGWFLLIWGVFVIGLADNVVRPLLMRRAGASAIHPLLLFFAIFSGIGLFGVSGIVFGPLLSALILVLASLYRETLGNHGTRPATPTTGL